MGLSGGLADNGGLSVGALPPSVENAASVLSLGSFNGATDGTAINALLTQLGGPGTVLVPGGTGVIDTPITLDAGQWLVGIGWGTVLQAKNSLNAAVVSNLGANSVGIGVINLLIDGNRANNTSGAGIKFDWTGNTVSSLSNYLWGATLSNLYIRFNAGDGYTGINPTNGMGIQASNVVITRSNGNGFTIQHSDSLFVNCSTEKTGLAGWVIGPNGAAAHLVNCLGADAGQVTPASGAGFKDTSGRCTFSGCFAQDNSLHGFWITNTDSTYAGCAADSNSFANGSANAAGFYLDTASARNNMNGCNSYDRFAGGARTQAYGFYVASGAVGNKLDGTSVNNNVLYDYFNAGASSNTFPGSVASTQQSGTTYTFAPADAGTVVESTGGSAAVFTIPLNATVAFPVGSVIEVFQQGAGQVTIAAAGGVTLVGDGSKVHTAAQNATIQLRQRATDIWALSGDLA